jgi:hypothetical protein
MLLKLGFCKNSYFSHLKIILQFSKWETHHIHGIGMHRDKNKGLHGDLGHVEPIISLFKPEIQHVECQWSGHNFW